MSRTATMAPRWHYRQRCLLAVIAALAFALSTGTLGAWGQDEAAPGPGGSADPLGAAVYGGICANPALAPADDLGALTPLPVGNATPGAAATPGAGAATGVAAESSPAAMGGAPGGSGTGIRVFAGQGRSDSTLTSLLEGPHLVLIREGTELTSAPLACGEIVGSPVEGQLAIVLRPTTGSEPYGVAVLSQANADADPAGNAGTEIDVYAFTGLTAAAGGAAATPGAGAGIDGDQILNVGEAGYLTEDLDADGALDEGEDLNGDGLLNQGIDADGDGVLDADEVVP